MLTHSDIEAVNTYANPLLMEFVAGLWLVVAWNSRKLPSKQWGGITFVAAIAAFTAWEMLYGTQPLGLRALVWGVPATLIVEGLLIIEQSVGLVRSRFLLLLGNASYSIYLVNVFVVAATWRVMRHAPVWAFFVTAIVASIVGGVIFWRVVERPHTRLARHQFYRPTVMQAVRT